MDATFVPLTALSETNERVSASHLAYGDFTRVLLVGDPGSGKSTVVKKLYRQLCQQAIFSPAHGRIPVLIELRRLRESSEAAGVNDSQSGYLYELLQHEVKSVETYASADLFSSFTTAGKLSVLLDGLDEVRTEELDSVCSAIVDLCDTLSREHPDNFVMVTTRRQLYVNLEAEFREIFSTHLTLQPFTAGEVYEFLERWPFKANRAEQVARISANLFSQPNIREMCSTPLVLAMYVARDELSGDENLPDTRPEFYRAVTDELLVRRRGRQLGITAGLNLLRRSRLRIVGRMALEHLLDKSQSKNTLSWESALAIVQEEERLEPVDAARYLRDLSRHTGLFTEERPEETLRFIHLTFCEFLAAQAITQGNEDAWTDIVEYISHAGIRAVERFAEVIVFAAALETNEGNRRRRIHWAISHREHEDLALRTIRDSQSYDDPVVVSALGQIAESVYGTSVDDRTATWFHRFQQLTTTLRDRELAERAVKNIPQDHLASFISDVIGDDVGQFNDLFEAYVRVDPVGALEMADVMDIKVAETHAHLLARVLDEPAVLARAVSEFVKSESDMRVWAPVIALGALYHRSVMLRLWGMETPDATKELIKGVGRPKGWHRCWPLNDHLVGGVLEAGCTWPGSSKSLAMLKDLPVRRSRVAQGIGNSPFMVWISFLLVAGILATLAQRYSTSPPPTILAVCIALTLSAISVVRAVMSPGRDIVDVMLGSGYFYFGETPSDHSYVAHLLEDDAATAIRVRDVIRDSRVLPSRSGSRYLPSVLGTVIRWSPNSRWEVFGSVAPTLAAHEIGLGMAYER